MTWDVCLIPSKKNSNLGPLTEVLKILKETLPEINLSDPKWGFIDQEDLAIDFNIGDRDPLNLIMLHIHAAGNFDKVMETIETLCKKTSWRAKDMATGKYVC